MIREHFIHPVDDGGLVGKISSYLQIINKDPRSTAFVPLAEAYRQIGLLDDALEVALAGTRMLPHFSPGFATLGRIFAQMGRIEDAKSAYAQSLSIDSQGKSALIGLARLHLTLGERVEARQYLQEAARYHPYDEMISSMLIVLDLPRPGSGIALPPEPTAAVHEDVDAGEQTGTPIPTATLAEIYFKQGLLDQAVRVYQEILRLDPGNTSAANRLRELCPTSITDSVVSSVGGQHKLSSANRLEIFERWLLAIANRRAHVQ